MKITQEDIDTILNSEVRNIENGKRTICKKCDYYGTVAHAGLACYKCGGEQINVGQFIIFNLLRRVQKHFRESNHEQSTTWLCMWVGQYLAKRDGLDFYDTYSFAMKQHEQIKQFYVNYLTVNSSIARAPS